MNRKTRTPSVDRAVAALRDYVAIAAARKLIRLPSVSTLSSAIGVSRVTLLRAIRRLTDEGLIIPKRGSGTFIQPALPHAATALPQHRPLRRTPAQVARDLRQRILRGRPGPGEGLPTVSALCRELGASHPTVARALRALVDEHLLVREGRRFLVSRLNSSSSTASVVLCAATDRRGSILMPNDLSSDLLRALESAAVRLGTELLFRLYPADRGRRLPQSAFPPTFRESAQPSDATGILVWQNGLSSRRVASIIADATKTGQAVVLLDEGISPSPSGSAGAVRFFPYGRTRPARDIARSLLAGGHRKIACLSANHESDTSIRRLTVLSDTFAEAGYPGNVRAFTVRSSDLEEYLADAGTTARQLVKSTLDRVLSSDLSEATRAAATAAERATRGILARDALMPLFRAAHADRSITAWVTGDDHLAAMALDFVSSQRVDVPGDLALVSVGNSSLASAKGISSYDHNLPQLAHAALTCVLRPQVAGSSEHDDEVPGALVFRDSFPMPV